MIRNYSKFILPVFIIILSLSITACGSDSSNGSKKDAVKKGTESPEPDPEPDQDDFPLFKNAILDAATNDNSVTNFLLKPLASTSDDSAPTITAKDDITSPPSYGTLDQAGKFIASENPTKNSQASHIQIGPEESTKTYYNQHKGKGFEKVLLNIAKPEILFLVDEPKAIFDQDTPGDFNKLRNYEYKGLVTAKRSYYDTGTMLAYLNKQSGEYKLVRAKFGVADPIFMKGTFTVRFETDQTDTSKVNAIIETELVNKEPSVEINTASDIQTIINELGVKKEVDSSLAEFQYDVPLADAPVLQATKVYNPVFDRDITLKHDGKIEIENNRYTIAPLQDGKLFSTERQFVTFVGEPAEGQFSAYINLEHSVAFTKKTGTSENFSSTESVIVTQLDLAYVSNQVVKKE